MALSEHGRHVSARALFSSSTHSNAHVLALRNTVIILSFFLVGTDQNETNYLQCLLGSCCHKDLPDGQRWLP